MTAAENHSTAAAARHRRVADDLRAESLSLQQLLHTLAPADWSTPTPAAGWSIQDQVNHLAYFDDATVLAIQNPDRFRQEAEELTASADDFPDRLVRSHRDLSPEQSAAWFSRARADLLATVAGTGSDTVAATTTGTGTATRTATATGTGTGSGTAAGARMPWYGPDMSITSALTARLMETWAHGQDVADALGVEREPTDRLRHIAHLGVATRAFSFRLRGLTPPQDDPFVELRAPGGELWRWGPPTADQRVTGPALDFCLVVTQRRHLADTALTIVGDQATRWLALAQAFAGAPGPGRDPLPRGEMS